MHTTTISLEKESLKYSFSYVCLACSIKAQVKIKRKTIKASEQERNGA
jgi:hypothetical protein